MVLSGDNDQEKGYLQSLFGHDAALRFNQSPVNKRDAIEEFRRSDSGLMMMVGDGLNDAGALQTADIGIAVSEKSGQFTPASDAILDAVQLPALHRFVAFGRDTRTVIFTNLGLSLLYNVTGLSFALAGLMTPVISAILMPLSSITIVLNATLLTSYFARKNQLR
jgi:Cu+-exporting ATPase